MRSKRIYALDGVKLFSHDSCVIVRSPDAQSDLVFNGCGEGKIGVSTIELMKRAEKRVLLIRVCQQ